MSGTKIICVTPNVALDRTLVVPGFKIGAIHRINEAIAVPGGKGLNVVRAIKILGGYPIAMGLLGGFSGQKIANTVQQDGYEVHWTWFDGETRICTILVSDEGQSSVINESGEIIEEDWNRLVADVCQTAKQVEIVCISGSMPSGAPESAPAVLIRSLNEQGKQVWVDTSGTALSNAIHALPYAIKVNGDELGEILNLRIDDYESAQKAGHTLLERGIEVVVITLGKSGAVLIDAQESIAAVPPDVAVVDTIASGDCVLAGIVQAVADENTHEEVLRAGIAAGTANALFAGGAQFTYESYLDILDKVTIKRL